MRGEIKKKLTAIQKMCFVASMQVRRNRLPPLTRTHLSPKGIRCPGIWFERATYSRTAQLRNGNGSKYDPVVCDFNMGGRRNRF